MNTNIDKKIKKGWNFDNSYTHLPETFYSMQTTQDYKISPSPKLIVLNKDLAKYLGLDIDELKSQEGVEILAANRIPENAMPIAQAYAGHQFGHFTMLGDGRALLLGEQITPQGERFDIQLKGSGRTLYSRGGDGKAALGPMLREYIISEAMNGLNIPTTRSLAVVTTGENIVRDRILPGAILTRVASSHIRVGTFQYISAFGTIEELQSLAEYTIQRHFPNISLDENRFLLLIKNVIKRQAELIAKWQLVGFIHGVMNTDNMTISGESIDFGPCAFMDIYDPQTVFSSIDSYGRYAYGNQPEIAAWNLARFAETLLPLLNSNEEKAIEIANEAILSFPKIYDEFWITGMRKKLGMFHKELEDKSIITELLSIMEKYNADFTNTFRALTIDELCGMELFFKEEFILWKEKWMTRLDKQQESKEESKQLMKDNNPAIIPRNHRVEDALEAANKGDYSVMERLIQVLLNPYEYSSEQNEYAGLPTSSVNSYRTFCGT
ncbi:MAG: YdiU family protein [Clostridiales bacterium]|nr:YdiU family protein [Clostridiales bacterium]